MKKVLNYLTPVLCVIALAFSVAAFSKACSDKVQLTSDNNNNIVAPSTPAGQPIDLTFAAEKSLPSVVHIKYVQNSRIQTVEVGLLLKHPLLLTDFGGLTRPETQERQCTHESHHQPFVE